MSMPTSSIPGALFREAVEKRNQEWKRRQEAEERYQLSRQREADLDAGREIRRLLNLINQEEPE